MSVSNAETLGRVNLSFPITFSAIASAALLIVLAWYWYEAQSIKETLIFFAAGVAAVGQITASFYTARVLAETLRKDKLDLKRAQEFDARENAREAIRLKQASIRFGERWNEASMFHARDTLRMIKKHHSASPEELNKFIEERETNVIHVINFFEEIGTACRHDIVVHEIMKEQFDDVVVDTWVILFTWIQKQRARNPAVLEDFEALYNKWKK